MAKTVTWILVADGARARFLKSVSPGKGLVSVFDHDLADDRRPTRKIVSDREGAEATRGGPGQHTRNESSDAHEHAEFTFARDVARRLEEGLIQGAYDRLIVVAAPDALGHLRKNMSHGVSDRVVGEINKNLVTATEAELEERLADYLSPPLE